MWSTSRVKKKVASATTAYDSAFLGSIVLSSGLARARGGVADAAPVGLLATTTKKQRIDECALREIVPLTFLLVFFSMYLRPTYGWAWVPLGLSFLHEVGPRGTGLLIHALPSMFHPDGAGVVHAFGHHIHLYVSTRDFRDFPDIPVTRKK